MYVVYRVSDGRLLARNGAWVDPLPSVGGWLLFDSGSRAFAHAADVVGYVATWAVARVQSGVAVQAAVG